MHVPCSKNHLLDDSEVIENICFAWHVSQGHVLLNCLGELDFMIEHNNWTNTTVK